MLSEAGSGKLRRPLAGFFGRFGAGAEPSASGDGGSQAPEQGTKNDTGSKTK
jgi:hypothetical protein